MIIDQEALHTLRHMTGKIGIKIDLEKAYDKLEWDFIKRMLTFFNFPSHTIKLIISCISSSHMAVIVNGEPTEFFTLSRGIYQGNPLSLCIFIMCMKYLSILIEEEVKKKNWKSLKLCKSGPRITHTLFVDDSVLFGIGMWQPLTLFILF